MRDPRVVAGLLFIAALAGCRAAPDHVELPGCYALHTGNGQGVSEFYNASPGVRLHATRLDGDSAADGRRRMVRLNAAGWRMDESSRASIRLPYWSYDPATDSLRLSFRNGFSGATLSLYAPPGPRDTLRGSIQENWDFGEPHTDHTTAYAVRIPCPITSF